MLDRFSELVPAPDVCQVPDGGFPSVPGCRSQFGQSHALFDCDRCGQLCVAVQLYERVQLCCVVHVVEGRSSGDLVLPYFCGESRAEHFQHVDPCLPLRRLQFVLADFSREGLDAAAPRYDEAAQAGAPRRATVRARVRRPSVIPSVEKVFTEILRKFQNLF